MSDPFPEERVQLAMACAAELLEASRHPIEALAMLRIVAHIVDKAIELGAPTDFDVDGARKEAAEIAAAVLTGVEFIYEPPSSGEAPS